jgi:rod shape-determining protein MreD
MAIICVAGLLSLQPVHLSGYARVAPAFALMAVYHWTLYRPDLLPPLALFVIGVVDDSLRGDHLGITALVFLISRAVVLRCRRRIFNRTFRYIWGGFAILTISAMIGLWITETALGFHLAGADNLTMRAVLMISIFPVASSVLGWAQRAFPS